MSHQPIVITDITIQTDQKICFEHFSSQILDGKQILIIGNNGSGKSTLLKLIQGTIKPTEGKITIPHEITFGYVPQIIVEHEQLSGGQKFNQALSYALSLDPDILCLDEPTNHLDLKNIKSLLGMLQRYQGTLLMISHDPAILHLNFDEIWNIEHGAISIFKGNYQEFCREKSIKQQQIERQRDELKKENKKLKLTVQKEHQRASKSASANKHENDKVLLGALKEKGSQSSGKNLKKLSQNQETLNQGLTQTFIHKKIVPNFNLPANIISKNKSIVSIVDGSCGYSNPILNNIMLQVSSTERIAIIGDNGSGKSTLVKVLLNDPRVTKEGEWLTPERKNIGYLDQQYSNLDPALTVLQTIEQAAPEWNNEQTRKHLNDFLFSKQKAVFNKVEHLSGGELVRLSLAQIAAQNPQLLILDEITNNIDLETRAHLIEVLSQYPGCMIIISHDMQFLEKLGITTQYETQNGTLSVIK